MFSKLSSLRWVIPVLLLAATACKKDRDDDDDNEPLPENPGQIDGFGLGWTGTDDLSSTSTSINFGFGDANLPPAADITNMLPPIGDQGQYGTCVAWAVGYNLKTAMDGQKLGLDGSGLSSPANQTSPKDLFTALPDNLKGPDCNGTNFTEAFNLLQQRGAATQQTVPYTNLGGCEQSTVQGSWTSEANARKIEYYRKVEPTLNDIKLNISNGIPVAMGAKLGDNFMTWNSDEVITSATSYNNVGQHAYHAMVVTGYDDSKGPNGAFKVINSWGQQWGAVGYIWVDYNYFLGDFCIGPDGSRPLYIAATLTPGEGGNDGPPEDNPNATGVDLVPWVFGDYNTQSWDYPNERAIDLNMYNIGSQTAPASANWSMYYVYFNAYDANDYGVIFYDEFNTSVSPNTYDCPTDFNCIFNLDLPANAGFAEYAFGQDYVTRYYYMPNITGDYYLALIADAEDVFGEQDELNNIFYTSYYPISFWQGVGRADNEDAFEFSNELQPNRETLDLNKYNSAVNAEFPNAYTTREISEFIKREKESGRLDSKVNRRNYNRGNQIYDHN